MSGLSVSAFDSGHRSDRSPALGTDTAYSYLNRSARSEAAAVRMLVDKWLSEYPASHRNGLVSRLKSPLDTAHHSAFFELAVHALLQVGHQKIVDVEAPVPGSSYTPDFLVETASGYRYFVEVVTVTGQSDLERASDRRLEDAVAAIESLSVPEFYLSVTPTGTPTDTITLRKLKRGVIDWLGRQPRDESVKDTAPFIYSEHGLTLEVSAHYVSAKSSVRAIGFRMMEPRWASPGEEIRESLTAKAKKYGPLPYPLVLAVNSLCEYDDENDVIDALLGTPGVAISNVGTGDENIRNIREPNGLWKSRERCDLVAAVLSTERLRPWSVGQRRARLISHPWTPAEIAGIELGIDHVAFRPKLHKTDGASLSAIFGLPEGWPEELISRAG